jgi:hypothetical protein
VQEYILFSKTLRPKLEPTQSHVHCVTVTLRRLDYEADHTPHFYPEVTSPHNISELAHGNVYHFISFYHLQINVFGGFDHLTLKDKQVLGFFSIISALTLSLALRYKPKVRGFDFPMVSLKFFINIILPPALWPWARRSH